MKKITFIILTILLLTPIISRAQDKYTLLEPLPCIQGVGNCDEGTVQPDIDLSTYINYVFKFSIALAAFLAVVMIIWGGFEIMLSEAIPAKMDGKQKIKDAIVGLIMVLASYLILNTIDPRLVAINTQIDPIKVDTSDVKNFYDALSNDLKNLSQESQLEARSLIEQNRSKQERIDELNYKNSSEEGLTDTEMSELENLKAQVKTNETKITTMTSGAIGAQRYRVVVDNYLTNIDNYSRSYSGSGRATRVAGVELDKQSLDDISLSKKSIEQYYDNKISQLDLKNDYIGEQILVNQKSFYVEQIDDEYNFRKDLYGYQMGVANKPILQASAKDYAIKLSELNSTDPSDNPKIEAIRNDTQLKTSYTATLNQRIKLINDTINKQ